MNLIIYKIYINKDKKEIFHNMNISCYTCGTMTNLCMQGFPSSSVGKESACNAGNEGSVPGSERSPREGYSNSLQYSCQENPMDRGWGRATVCLQDRKKSDTTEQLSTHTHTHTHTHTYTRQIDFIFLSMHPQILSSPCISIFCPKQSIQFVLQSKACRRLSLSLNHVKSHHSTPVTLLSTYFCHLVLSISISALTLLDLALPISDLCPEPASYLVSLPLTQGPLERILLI